MPKKNTNEHDYYKNLKNFLTYHYNKNNLNQTELANVLSYCRSNWSRIGTDEVDAQNANVVALMKLKPIDLCRYFKYLAYGTEEPGPDVKPTKRRANSLLAYKRSISYYMPLNSNNWHVIRKEGNPTKCSTVSKVIAKVKLFEARKLGAKARSVRSYTVDEYNNVARRGKKKVMKRELQITRFLFSAILVLQNCMAGRIDDMIMLDTDEIKKSYEKGLLEIKLTWSKNIYSENGSYWQLIMGSMDPQLCPLIALGAYVGFFNSADDLMKHENRERPLVEPEDNNWIHKQHQEPLLPGFFRVNKNKKISKQSYRNRLAKINEAEGIIGCSTHSVRKKATEEMQDCQLSRKISVQRGRWQDDDDRRASAIYHKRLNKGYDFKAANCLAGPLGSCRYHVDGLTANIVKELLPAGDTLKAGCC